MGFPPVGLSSGYYIIRPNDGIGKKLLTVIKSCFPHSIWIKE